MTSITFSLKNTRFKLVTDYSRALHKVVLVKYIELINMLQLEWRNELVK